jgi:hypothetical protein
MLFSIRRNYMKYRRFQSIAIGLLLFVAGSSLFAQSQADRDAKRREIVVILDVSRSMESDNKFTNVMDYRNREIVDGLLKNGDDFTLVVFGTGAREQFTRTINSASDRAQLKEDLRRLEPTDSNTDIGMAMEKCAEIIERPEKADTRRVILFITDGLNAPRSDSKYYGVDISSDERFKSLGDRISKGSWFLYVIGIGGQTAAGDVAGLIPGSELLTTDSSLSGADVNTKVSQQEEEERAREDAEKTREEEALRLEEERKLEEEPNAGLMGFLRRLADSLGIPLPALIAGFFLLLLLLILLVVFLVRAFRTKEIIVTDEGETLIRKIPPFGSIMLNSAAAVLPGIGNENNQVIRINRHIVRFAIQTMDSQAIAETSPYKKQGAHPLKGVIALANGRLVRITIR